MLNKDVSDIMSGMFDELHKMVGNFKMAITTNRISFKVNDDDTKKIILIYFKDDHVTIDLKNFRATISMAEMESFASKTIEYADPNFCAKYIHDISTELYNSVEDVPEHKIPDDAWTMNDFDNTISYGRGIAAGSPVPKSFIDDPNVDEIDGKHKFIFSLGDLKISSDGSGEIEIGLNSSGDPKIIENTPLED